MHSPVRKRGKKTLPARGQIPTLKIHEQFTVQIQHNKMKKHLILTACTLCLLCPSGAATADDVLKLQVSRPGDVEMACGALSQEAVLMRDIINTTEDIKDDSKLKNHGISAAAGIGSFLVGSATGGIGFAAAGLLLKNATNNTKDEADHIQDIAEQRRSFMIGVYNAKGCKGPIDHALQDNVEGNDDITQMAAVEPASGDENEPHVRKEPTYNQ